MKISTYSKPLPALILFTVGILLGITLSVLAVWADYEAASYGFANRASAPLPGLSCPILMTNNEHQTVSLKIINRTDQVISPTVRTDISTPLVAETTSEFLELAAGESRLLKWTVGPQNIDLGQFIFVNALAFSSYPVPDRENTCGIFVLPVGGSGKLILILATIISVLSITGGAYLLQKSSLPGKQTRPSVFLAIVTLLTLTVSFLGLWIQGIFLLVITILLIFTILSLLLGQNI
ncbi:MAG: hypothetical protein H7Y59_10410 [Anaerolineales bacterium]|nr:hypothetical protein [Anaerolineales bacterium]